jgi:hypothetical protein
VHGRSRLTEDQETSTITKKNKIDAPYEVPDEDRAIDKEEEKLDEIQAEQEQEKAEQARKE